MSRFFSYDPEAQPDAEAWLTLSEQERISAAEKFHRDAMEDLPNLTAHAVFHVIIENQFAMGLGPVLRALPRLVKQGLSRHDAIHAVGHVLAGHLHEQANAKTQDSVEVAQARYDAAVERLNAKDWLAKRGSK
jgi:hypothetical protein